MLSVECQDGESGVDQAWWILTLGIIVYCCSMMAFGIISCVVLYRALNFGLLRTKRRQIVITTVVCQLLIISALIYSLVQISEY
jgi:cbb3-type cytochrome oxidase subunit 1